MFVCGVGVFAIGALADLNRRDSDLESERERESEREMIYISLRLALSKSAKVCAPFRFYGASVVWVYYMMHVYQSIAD